MPRAYLKGSNHSAPISPQTKYRQQISASSGLVLVRII